MLGGLGLLFPDYIQHRNKSNVDIQNVLTTFFQAKLAGGFKIGKRFDVADSSTYFYQHKVDSLFLGKPAEPIFDLVGYVRYDLDTFTEKVALALSLYD